MKQNKYCFIDRDGTLIAEPEDQQVDSLEKLALLPNVIPALRQLKSAGYQLVMVSNQDGLGTQSFPSKDFEQVQNFLLKLLSSQGIEFDDIRICPHFAEDNCFCRKPNIGLLQEYCVNQQIDQAQSFVIGDRASDIQLANNLGITGIQINNDWNPVIQQILQEPNSVFVERKTNETDIRITLSKNEQKNSIETGLSFFDHMLDQLIKHSGLSVELLTNGDLEIDEHHTVEDTALTLGAALKKWIGDKRGIQRYGFLLPMDESLAQVAIDLSGRPCCVFKARFQRSEVGGLSTECVEHFFESFSQSLGAAIHITINGKNTHHMIEAAFKGTGRALKQAISKQGFALPSTKGIL